MCKGNEMSYIIFAETNATDRYFAAEIIGNQLDLEPRKWRRPRRLDLGLNRQRIANFKKRYDKYDWTHLIPKA